MKFLKQWVLRMTMPIITLINKEKIMYSRHEFVNMANLAKFLNETGLELVAYVGKTNGKVDCVFKGEKELPLVSEQKPLIKKKTTKKKTKKKEKKND